MSNLIALTILASALTTTIAQESTCPVDHINCIVGAKPGTPAACSSTGGAGSYFAALICGEALFSNPDCASQADQLFIIGAQISFHSTCMMECGKATECPYDTAAFKAAVSKVSGPERDKSCLMNAIDCQDKWDKCTSGTCPCTQDAIACTRVASEPCPDFAMMGMDVPGLPGTLIGVCKKISTCTTAQCDGASSLSASALLAVIASIVIAVSA